MNKRAQRVLLKFRLRRRENLRFNGLTHRDWFPVKPVDRAGCATSSCCGRPGSGLNRRIRVFQTRLFSSFSTGPSHFFVTPRSVRELPKRCQRKFIPQSQIITNTCAAVVVHVPSSPSGRPSTRHPAVMFSFPFTFLPPSVPFSVPFSIPGDGAGAHAVKEN